MRFIFLMVLAVAAFAACNSADHASKLPSSNPDVANKPKPADAPHADNARRINITEAQNLIAKNQAVVIDVRNQAAYDQAHIRGAKLIPFGEVANRTGELPRDKTIITYCSWPNEHTSAGAVDIMKNKGIENAAALVGGFDGWKQAGLPVDSKQ